MLPTIVAQQLQQGIGEYIKTTFPMTNAPFRGSLDALLEGTNNNAVYHEPYVAVRLPFRADTSGKAYFTAIHSAYAPYLHQVRAWARLTGDDARPTLVATGTGSGKTECFLYPILEYCANHWGEKGIKALIIYPMNALASDQARRIAAHISANPALRGRVRAGMYVGGMEAAPTFTMSETSVITDHDTLLHQPPDILLTNYKMLDYLLVRPKDTALWAQNTADTLKYIAVDELHTFDGAQGTDLACLLRRLKSRLGMEDGSVCCVGTSATMGSQSTAKAMTEYAQEIFGEPFDQDSVITEDRQSAEEFFADTPAAYFAVPTPQQAARLRTLADEDDPGQYLRLAAAAWLPEYTDDIHTPQGRIALGKALMAHDVMQALLSEMAGRYYKLSAVAEKLLPTYPFLAQVESASDVLGSLIALVSHARSGTPEALRPFLTVQVQLWMRELRRLVAKVDPQNITYALARDLNAEQQRQYLPVINCRDCGKTGWVTILNEKGNAAITNLEAFYNNFFAASDKVKMLFPGENEAESNHLAHGRICPNCLQLQPDPLAEAQCPACGKDMIPVLHTVSAEFTHSREKHRRYTCPFCHSDSGLSLMGLRSASEISVGISQLFASRFNDDKKLLAFSDSVQDAAHRAGFFNARTWRFGLRSAIQGYCAAEGAGKTLADFQTGFVQYWQTQMRDEEFVGWFIAPNQTWRREYEEMLRTRKLPAAGQEGFLECIADRLKYEIVLEFGVASHVGRTLEKSGCCALQFPPEQIRTAAQRVRERVHNELNRLTTAGDAVFERMVYAFLDTMRSNGAFDDPVFHSFIKEHGASFMLTNERIKWMPGIQSWRNVPRFLIQTQSQSSFVRRFDTVYSPKYVRRICACAGSSLSREDAGAVGAIVLKELLHAGMVVQMPSPADMTAFGISKKHVYMSDHVAQLRCSSCTSVFPVAAQNARFVEGGQCPRCTGTLEIAPDAGLGYYGRLYSSGDMARVNAREHTGLLGRDGREQLEDDFKRGSSMRNVWDPNVLSCTPTLEMGIDIGDLSTVVLCSIPPGGAQYVQRAGRAGRKDGNALTLAVANARPHDLYFYADPLDMIAGEVKPPKVFLRAGAVLERQLTAFCMDNWVRKNLPPNAVPQKIGKILDVLDAHPADMFPFNFLGYVKKNVHRLCDRFILKFQRHLDSATEAQLRTFAQGAETDSGSLAHRVLTAFTTLKKQCNSLRANVRQIRTRIQELEAKPKDQSHEDQIKELRAEAAALTRVITDINDKYVFNFLSDEGLLPNYAFPEAGVILRAVLYRRDTGKDEQTGKGKKAEKLTFEYNRSASSAISEFAPSNTFYAEGHKLKIDQIDIPTAQVGPWRLCPNCSHAMREDSINTLGECPKCHSPGWNDIGQVHTMIKAQTVYSNEEYDKSQIGDDSEDRHVVFYTRQILVEVDEAKDITGAWKIDSDETVFGYEFVRKAVLREINFGESDMTGQKMSVAGSSQVRKGFRICKHCGKIQQENERPRHSLACPVAKTPGLAADAYEECLFLYREFTTEILRILIPATTMEGTGVVRDSFMAAFMLGMEEYFGNVGHLRTALCDEPVPDAAYRKQYLVIYDSVPGGTGYLKQLLNEQDSLLHVLEKARTRISQCDCKNDETKDGCYHCLFGFRQSRNLGGISRKAALETLDALLQEKDKLIRIDSLSGVSVENVFDSELEARFIEAFGRLRNKNRAIEVNKVLLESTGTIGYRLVINDARWDIEPQVDLGPADGVAIPCRPDFVLRPRSQPGRLPVAVFTDGFTYHKDIVADDTRKREAIRRSGKYMVWTLSWNDVQSVFEPMDPFATATLAYTNMPSGVTIFNRMAGSAADFFQPEKTGMFELLVRYLERPDAEAVMAKLALTYSWSMLERKKQHNEAAFAAWSAAFDQVNKQIACTDKVITFGQSLFGAWAPRQDLPQVCMYACAVPQKKEAAVVAILADAPAQRTDKYEQEWNGFWHLFNVLQFNREFIAVSSTGLEEWVYTALTPWPQPVAAAVPALGWDAVIEELLQQESKDLARRCQAAGLPVPDLDEGLNHEVLNGNEEYIITIAWPEQKIGCLAGRHVHNKHHLETLGWTIFDEPDAALFGE